MVTVWDVQEMQTPPARDPGPCKGFAMFWVCMYTSLRTPLVYSLYSCMCTASLLFPDQGRQGIHTLAKHVVYTLRTLAILTRRMRSKHTGPGLP
jgi:hypothetical protein